MYLLDDNNDCAGAGGLGRAGDGTIHQATALQPDTESDFVEPIKNQNK